MRLTAKNQLTLIGSNYALFLVGSAANVALVPIYVGRLGIENWAIVAWSSTLTGIFAMLDLGISQIMPRDLAQSEREPGKSSEVYHTYRALYQRISIAGLLTLLAALPWLSEKWFNQNATSLIGDAQIPLALSLVQAAFQLANLSSINYFVGTGRQGESNTRSGFFVIGRHCAALTGTALLGPSALSYTLSTCIVGILEYGLNQYRVNQLLENLRSKETIGKKQSIRSLVINSGLVSTAVILGMIACQSDRILLAKKLSPAAFAEYAIIASAGIALIQLQNPIVKAFTTRFALAAQGRESAHSILKGLVLYLGVIYLTPLILIAIFATEILGLWMPKLNSELATNTLRLFCLAGALSAIYQVYYQVLIAHHESRRVLGINIGCLLSVGIFWGISWPNASVTSGAEMWVCLSATQVGLGFLILRRGPLKQIK